MAELLDLPSELLEQIFFMLEDVPDMLSLGSSCALLSSLLSTPRLWRNLLAKTKMVQKGRWVMEDRIRKMPTQILPFMTTVSDPEALFRLLHEAVCARFPASGPGLRQESISVTCPSHPSPHTVSGLGLQLLVATDRQGQGHTLHSLALSYVLGNGPLLLALGALAGLQEQRVTELVSSGAISCSTEEEGRALCSLLELCTTWRLEVLSLGGEVGGETWAGLGRAAARGRLGRVVAGREVVGRGRAEEVRLVWGRTEVSWLVGQERIARWLGEEGWGVLVRHALPYVPTATLRQLAYWGRPCSLHDLASCDCRGLGRGV